MIPMTVRERFHAVMGFREFDRLPIVEWAGWWNKTLARWQDEGLSRDLDRYGVYRHLGMDLWQQLWIPAQLRSCPAPSHEGGGIIRDAADYERIRPHLFPAQAVDRRTWAGWAGAQRDGSAVLWCTIEGFFWFPRTLFGIEEHLLAFYDQPELMARINEDLVAWHLRVIDDICDVAPPDFITFAEDMSYNNGPMLSKEMFDRFLLPCYRRVVPRLKERGVRVIVDSDGDITGPAAWFAEAGFDGILPLERQSGVDIAELRRSHPRMRFIGHFDKLTMDKGEAAMRAEFERLLPVAAGGGFIPSCDHQTPPAVSLADYRLYLRLFREYAERAAAGRGA